MALGLFWMHFLLFSRAWFFFLTKSHSWLDLERFCPVKSSSRILGAEKNHVKDDLRANFELFIFTRNPQPISLKFLNSWGTKRLFIASLHSCKILCAALFFSLFTMSVKWQLYFCIESYQEILNNIARAKSAISLYVSRSCIACMWDDAEFWLVDVLAKIQFSS